MLLTKDFWQFVWCTLFHHKHEHYKGDTDGLVVRVNRETWRLLCKKCEKGRIVKV